VVGYCRVLRALPARAHRLPLSGTRDAYLSVAGITFSNRTLKAEWAARYGHTSVVDAAGAIYVIGGIFGDFTYYQDVWVSTDGGARPDSRSNRGH
jgi:hypothetical protein